MNNASLLDRILVTLQHLLPARAMGRLVYRLSRSRRAWLKNMLIRGFCRLFPVDIAESALPVPDGFGSFNEFFTRELKAGAREFTGRPDELLSPADGTMAHFGIAEQTTLLQAKGVDYQLGALLADEEYTQALTGGAYSTVYLAPYNYRRLHMPLSGRLMRTVFVPGLLYSVNARTTATIPGLYALNERLVCLFEGDHGPFAVVLVGAMNVASISTAWGGEIIPPPDGQPIRTDFPAAEAPVLSAGDYMGHFNMGSTAVLVVPAAFDWSPSPRTGEPVRVGQALGQTLGRR